MAASSRAIPCSLFFAVLALCACSAEQAAESMEASEAGDTPASTAMGDSKDAAASTAPGNAGPTAPEARADAGPRVCDPLAVETEPAMLGRVIAVGRAADGTLYVASSVRSDLDRIFVLESGALQRRNVLGSGTGGGAAAGDYDYTASFEDGGAQSRLVIKRRANVVVGMALVHDGGKSFFDALPSDATQLEVVDAREVQSLPLRKA